MAQLPHACYGLSSRANRSLYISVRARRNAAVLGRMSSVPQQNDRRQAGIVPLVSIGLPTFNRAKSLRRAIESVLAQDYVNLELVISDNSSSDETPTVCEEYRLRDSRVKYVHQRANCGAHSNFQTVLDEARGQYFMWLGDDDWLQESYVSRCVEILMARPEISLVCGVARYFDEDRLAFEGVRMELLQDSPTDRVLAFYRQVSDNGTFYGVAPRALLVALPIGKGIGSDWLLIASLALKGKIFTLDDVVVSRARDGVSADLQSLALKSGLSEREAERPYQGIARNVFRDIMFESPAFAELGAASRLAIACKVMLILYNRFIINEHPLAIWSNRVRYKLKLRTRIKRTLRIS